LIAPVQKVDPVHGEGDDKAEEKGAAQVTAEDAFKVFLLFAPRSFQGS
jgi:hypothetical protein